MERRIGTAGWALPSDVRDRFAGDGSQLERYARVFSCVEINSSFYRPHRLTTYARWAASVPDGFRFALKLPREITHRRRLVGVDEPLESFLDESAGLGAKRDVLLVQLPPSLAFEGSVAEAFFALLRSSYAGRIACEPRHASWFEPPADQMLRAHDAARVAADPPPVPAAAEPGGAATFTYRRLHGSPDVYWSSYDDAQITAIAAALRTATAPAWCIFDNTARGAATPNALATLAALG